MMIQSSARRRRGSPAVERLPLRMRDDRPASSLLVHGENGQDAELTFTTVEEADDLVAAALALQAELAIAVAANTTAGAA